MNIEILEKALLENIANDQARKDLMELIASEKRSAAKSEFAAAFVAMQAEMPNVAKLGKADRYKFTQWEDVNETIKPVLSKHGFYLSFDAFCREGNVSVTAILTHVGGHFQTAEMTLASGEAGPMKGAQQIGSALSYGQRYTAKVLLNLTYGGEDDDAQSVSYPARAQATARPGLVAQRMIERINAAKTLWELEAWKTEHGNWVKENLTTRDVQQIGATFSSRQKALTEANVQSEKTEEIDG